MLLPNTVPLAVPAAFVIGAVTFVGPCAPARLTSSGNSKMAALSIIYAIGTMLGFATLGALGSLLFEAVFVISPWMYAIIGVAAIVAGVRELLVRDEAHDHAAKATSTLSSFASGYASAWTLAPCCTPIVVAAITISSAPWQTALVLAAYGLGHSLPILLLQRFTAFLTRPRTQDVISLALGGLGIALGAYYLVLA